MQKLILQPLGANGIYSLTFSRIWAEFQALNYTL